jgi:peptidase E
MKPLYLTAGQGLSHVALAKFFAAALAECGTANPAVAYIGTASDDDQEFYDMIRSLILKAGARDVQMAHLCQGPVDVFAAKRLINSCEAIFVNGGDVFAGMQALKKYGLVPFLQEQFQKGKLFFGLSAGAIMLGQHWVNWDEAKGGDTPEEFDCLGLAPASFDTHAEEDGWAELKALLKLMGPGSRGYGIPRGGCIKIDQTGAITDLGKRPVVVLTEKH